MIRRAGNLAGRLGVEFPALGVATSAGSRRNMRAGNTGAMALSSGAFKARAGALHSRQAGGGCRVEEGRMGAGECPHTRRWDFRLIVFHCPPPDGVDVYRPASLQERALLHDVVCRGIGRPQSRGRTPCCSARVRRSGLRRPRGRGRSDGCFRSRKVLAVGGGRSRAVTGAASSAREWKGFGCWRRSLKHGRRRN